MARYDLDCVEIAVKSEPTYDASKWYVHVVK